MTQIGLALIFFVDFILYMVFFDIILSWLTLLGFKWRPSFLNSVIDPIYHFINKYISTTFGMFRFDALIVILIIYFIKGLLIINIPGLEEEILRLTSFY